MIKKQQNNGFTLIELLVVVAIIAILATVTLVSLAAARAKARDARRENDIREMGLAMEMATNDDQKYPTSATIPATISSSKQIYVAAVPEDPRGGDYDWSDNTADDQTYCVGADIEKGDYFECSQNGCFFSANACP